jgi:KRAB domain-containing zinc finger protein
MAQWASYNPWSVNSVHDFWFLRCPECPFDSKDEVHFQAHAIEKHPASLTLFGKSVKTENFDNDYEFVEYKNEAATEPLFSPEVHIKEEFIENDSIEHKFEPKKKKKKIRNDCGICGEKFPKNSELKKHIAIIHEKISEEEYEANKPAPIRRKISNICKVCGEKFQRNSELKKHIAIVHDKISEEEYELNKPKPLKRELVGEKYNCPDCDKDFTAITGLKMHQDAVHEGIRYNCEQCDKTFSQPIGLRKHVESLHEGIRYNCSKCDKSFTQKGEMNAHIKTVHEEKNPEELLNDQIEKEKKKIKSFKCLLCDKTFSKSSHLKVHTESVHEGIKVICPICGIATSSRDGLKKHHRTVHLGIKRKENNKKNMCPICSKMLTCSLQRHISAVHKKEKPFSCMECNASFAYLYRLTRHTTAVHEGIKPKSEASKK